jgi:hypothetical protein
MTHAKSFLPHFPASRHPFSIVVFCFTIYAACCGQNCAKFVLGGVYLVYAAALLGLSFFLTSHSNRTSLVDLAENFWNLDDAAPANDTETEFGCKCWSLNKYQPPSPSDTHADA